MDKHIYCILVGLLLLTAHREDFEALCCVRALRKLDHGGLEIDVIVVVDELEVLRLPDGYRERLIITEVVYVLRHSAVEL